MPTRSPSPRAPARPRATVPSCRAGRPAAARARAAGRAPAGRRRRLRRARLRLRARCGCHRKEAAVAPPPPLPKPALGAVDVQIAAPPDDKDAAPRRRAARAGVARAPARHGAVLRRRGPAGRGSAARIGTEAVEAGAVGEARARVGLQLDDGRADAPDGLSFKLEGRGSERYAIPKRTRKGPSAQAPDRAAILNRLVLRIAGDLIDGYVARRQLERGPPAAVHAALQADGGELRDEAIRAVGERKLRDEVPTLLKLLERSRRADPRRGAGRADRARRSPGGQRADPHPVAARSARDAQDHRGDRHPRRAGGRRLPELRGRHPRRRRDSRRGGRRARPPAAARKRCSCAKIRVMPVTLTPADAADDRQLRYLLHFY